jgi:hypothetical protein
VSFAYATRYLAAASAIACAGFSALGAVQALRYTPQLYRVGVPVWLTMPMAQGSHALGGSMERWSVDAHVAVLKALPASVRYAVVEFYNPQLKVPKTTSPGPVGAKNWTAPAVLRQAKPVAPVAPARAARPTPLASLPHQPAVAQRAPQQTPQQTQGLAVPANIQE